jgi:hypothetical protein
MRSLVIVDHQAGVNHSGNPPEQGEKKAQDKTQEATGHQDGDRREGDAEKVAERFHEQYV